MTSVSPGGKQRAPFWRHSVSTATLPGAALCLPQESAPSHLAPFSQYSHPSWCCPLSFAGVGSIPSWCCPLSSTAVGPIPSWCCPLPSTGVGPIPSGAIQSVQPPFLVLPSVFHSSRPHPFWRHSVSTATLPGAALCLPQESAPSLPALFSQYSHPSWCCPLSSTGVGPIPSWCCPLSFSGFGPIPSGLEVVKSTAPQAG